MTEPTLPPCVSEPNPSGEPEYGIRWKVETGRFPKSSFNGEWGGTHALILISIVGEGQTAHEGSKSFAVLSLDGRGFPADPQEAGPVLDTEMFQAMTHIADKLLRPDVVIPTWQRDVCQSVLDQTRAALALLRHRPKTETP